MLSIVLHQTIPIVVDHNIAAGFQILRTDSPRELACSSRPALNPVYMSARNHVQSHIMSSPGRTARGVGTVYAVTSRSRADFTSKLTDDRRESELRSHRWRNRQHDSYYYASRGINPPPPTPHSSISCQDIDLYVPPG